MREVLPEIEANLDENDKIVLDKGYVGLEKEVTKGIWLIKKKAHRDYPLKEEDIKFNQKIEKVRRHIEFGFGDLKSFFDILFVQFRHKREWITSICRFCVAIYNNIILYENAPQEFQSEYIGPILKLSKKMKKQNKILYHCCVISMHYLFIYQ
jgi:IS5 family transposase